MNGLIAVIVLAILAAALFVLLLVREKRISDLSSQKVELQTKLQMQEKTNALVSEERRKAFESQKAQMEESFKVLSEMNSNRLRTQNAESIGELLKPIQEKFTGFEKQVRETREKSEAQSAALKESIGNVLSQARNVGDEARNLANALTGHSKLQGDFGEMLLSDILRQSGLEEGVHFVCQGVLRDDAGHEIKSDAGATMIPDVVVNYPDGGQVVIDSKVSLKAFVNYMNADTVEDRKRYAREHVSSILSHVDELKTKDYASYVTDSRKKVDFNIMFIPMENAYRLMLDESPSLWQKAKDAKVLIVSQQNLMIVLNMILMGWRQHDQQKNIQEVYRTAAELMSQLKGWMDSFVKVGDSLQKARDAYEDSRKKLCESNQSVIKKIDKLEKLKVGPKRSNASIRSGSRIVGGQESIIPQELSDNLDQD